MTNWEIACDIVNFCSTKKDGTPNQKCEEKCTECIVVDRMEIISYIELALNKKQKVKRKSK